MDRQKIINHKRDLRQLKDYICCMIDISLFLNQRFGSVVVLSQKGVDQFGFPTWLCQCDCGRQFIAKTNAVTPKFISASKCPCSMYRTVKRKPSRHGMSGSREYRIWIDTIVRYSRSGYGNAHAERGITVYPAWVEDFEAFIRDVGLCPWPEGRLVRVDRAKGYEPGNVEWTGMAGSSADRSNARMLTHDGKTASLHEWAKASGLNASTIHSRLAAGWTVDRALTTMT